MKKILIFNNDNKLKEISQEQLVIEQVKNDDLITWFDDENRDIIVYADCNIDRKELLFKINNYMNIITDNAITVYEIIKNINHCCDEFADELKEINNFIDFTLELN